MCKLTTNNNKVLVSVVLALIAFPFDAHSSVALKPSNRFLRAWSMPWAAPIDVCFPSYLGSIIRSAIFRCLPEECFNTEQGEKCHRPVVKHLYNSVDCSGSIAESTFFRPGHPDYFPWCYEEEEFIDGATVDPADYEAHYAIIRLTKGRRIGSDGIDDALLLNNSTDYGGDADNETTSNAQTQTDMFDFSEWQLPLDQCIIDEGWQWYRTLPVVTNKCFLMNTSLVPHYQNNNNSLFQAVFDEDWAWFKIRCDADSLWIGKFDSPDCDDNAIHEDFPLIAHDGCKNHQFLGSYWFTEVLACSNVTFISRAPPRGAQLVSLMCALLALLWFTP